MDTNSPDSSVSPPIGSNPQLRFGKIEGFASRGSAPRSPRRGNICFLSSMKRDTGAANSKPTRPSNPITFCCIRCWEPAIRSVFRRRRIGSAPPERRRRMEHLCSGPVEYQRLGEGLFRTQAGRVFGRSSGAAARPQEDSRDGRRHRSQYIYQDLSLLFRTIRLRRRTGDSAGDRAVSELVLVQHLRNFVVVAGHPGAAFDLPTPRSRSRRFRAKWASKSCSSAACRNRACICTGRRSWSRGVISSWFSIA